MFTAIAPRYDFLNRLLSFGYDRRWRKTLVDMLAPKADGPLPRGERFLDVATGTADIALEIAVRGPGVKIAGVDFSHRMVELGKRKIIERNLRNAIDLQVGDGECLPFADGVFHGATCAFGIRNYADIEKGLAEIRRVLKGNGKIAILEFSMPDNFILKSIYRFYFNFMLPLLGNAISGHRSAYSYLPRSVSQFPETGDFARILQKAGFRDVIYRRLTLGIVSIYTGLKHV